MEFITLIGALSMPTYLPSEASVMTTESSPLVVAVLQRDLESVNALLSSQDNTKILFETTSSGSTVFMEAAKKGDAQILKALLRALLKLETQLVRKAYHAKFSGTNYAAYWRKSGTKADRELKALLAEVYYLSHPSSMLTPHYPWPTEIDEYALLKSTFSQNINLQDSQGNTPLMQMIASSKPGMVEWILSQPHVDLNPINDKNKNAFMMLVKKDWPTYLKLFLKKLRTLDPSNISEIYNVSQMLNAQRKPCSIRQYFYATPEGSSLVDLEIHTLFKEIEQIAIDFKASDEIELDERLKNASKPWSLRKATIYRRKLIRFLTQERSFFLEEKIPPVSWVQSTVGPNPLIFRHTLSHPLNLGKSVRFSEFISVYSTRTEYEIRPLKNTDAQGKKESFSQDSSNKDKSIIEIKA